VVGVYQISTAALQLNYVLPETPVGALRDNKGDWFSWQFVLDANRAAFIDVRNRVSAACSTLLPFSPCWPATIAHSFRPR
jgi:hypothetical protein